MKTDTQASTIELPGGARVSALLDVPDGHRALYVFAHGAGAGMTHPFMAGFAAGLAARGIAVLRYQFPFIEQGAKRPDAAPLAQATVRAAVAHAAGLLPGVPLYAGGKSFGGRMTSQAQAATPLAGVRGLVFVGFPLHPPEKPSIARAAHLDAVDVPMLFLQGSRDALAQPDQLTPLVSALGERATLHLLPDADHAFHVRKSSGTTDADTLASMLDTTHAWIVPGSAAATGAAILLNN